MEFNNISTFQNKKNNKYSIPLQPSHKSNTVKEVSSTNSIQDL